MFPSANRPTSGGAALLLLALLAPSTVIAQDTVAPEDLRKEVLAAKKNPDGWKHSVNVGATGAMTTATDVIGTADGTTAQIGAVLDGALTWTAAQQELRTTLRMQYAQTRTPALDAFVKSADVVDLGSTWMYRLTALDWVGPYARARAVSQMTDGYLMRPGATTVVRTPAAGAASKTEMAAKDRIALAGAFEPVLIAESAGAFANPIESKALTVKAKIGIGAQHFLTSGGYAVADDAKTPELELKQLVGSHQAGGVFELQADGAATEQVSWKGQASVFAPLYSSTTTATGLDAMSYELLAGVSVKLASWASLDYVVSARRLPAILDKWQTQSNLLITTGFKLP